ncbi:MAG: hypothetical protein IPK82_04630 [Polyangiaceae bacterium]|nr:hypothetical protein [Polyangiaceae bacterium]
MTVQLVLRVVSRLPQGGYPGDESSVDYLAEIHRGRSVSRMGGVPPDPWLESQLEAAMAPYVGRLPAEELDWMRERLIETLMSEAKGIDLVRKARPRVVLQSGAMRKLGGEAKPPIKVAASDKRRGKK